MCTLCVYKDAVEIFDPSAREWSKVEFRDPYPQHVIYVASASGDHSFYAYCDCYRKDKSLLYEYNTVSHTWTFLSDSEQEDSPERKLGCKMVLYNENQLMVYGGISETAGSVQPGATYQQGVDDEGFHGVVNNELHVFDLGKSEVMDTKIGLVNILFVGQWYNPAAIKGLRPPLLVGFTLTKISDNHVILFGGREANSPRYNGFPYLLQLDTMVSLNSYKSPAS